MAKNNKPAQHPLRVVKGATQSEKDEVLQKIAKCQTLMMNARAVIKMVSGFESKDVDLTISQLNEMIEEINQMEEGEDTLPKFKEDESNSI